MSAAPADNQEALGDEAGAHAALFAHVGVTDATDWQSVALRLAERYAPETLQAPEGRPKGANGGRPETRGPARLSALSFFIELIRDASANGRMRTDLKSTRAICRFIASDHKDAAHIRRMLELPPDVNPRTIENLISKLRRNHPDLVAVKPRY
jgi:hypothetical protein